MTVADLPLFRPLPTIAPTRRAHPATSRTAAETVRNLTARHRAVWEALRTLGPSADFELEASYDQFATATWWVAQTPQSLRSRRAMLAHPHYGLVVTDGRKRRSPNGGHPALVFAAVDPDRAAVLFRQVP